MPRQAVFRWRREGYSERSGVGSALGQNRCTAWSAEADGSGVRSRIVINPMPVARPTSVSAMSKPEVLRSIKAAEAAATEAVDAAKRKAAERLAAARKTARQTVADARTQAMEAATATLAAARTAAEAEAAQVAKDGDAGIESIREQGGVRRGAAVDAVVARFADN